MLNSIQNISAYARIIPSPEVTPLKFQTSLHQDLFILIILIESKKKTRFNFNTNPFLHLLYKKIDNKIIIIAGQDSIKNNPNLFLNFSRELSLISGIRIWGDYKREIFDKENPDALFYKISQQNLPLSNSSISFSETLYSYLKRFCLFEKFICGGNKYYIPQFKNNNKNKFFFGRENELKILNKNYNRIKYEYSGECYNIITVKGEPGIGKTSLVKAYLKERGRGNSFFISNPHTVQPYSYFLEFTNSLHGQTRDFKSSIKSFAASVGDLKLRKNLIDSIPHFPQNFSKESFLNNNEEISQNAILAFRNLILGYAYICASQKKPLILAFDDIQWADVSSIKTINFILDDFRNNFERSLPLQFIFIYRASYTIGIKPDTGNSTELELDTLDSAASHNYLQELLRINALNLSKKIQSSLLVKSGGNPLFLEEIVEHIKYNNNEIPASVKEIIKQRFFSLPEKFANFLKACSVIGKEIDLRTANCVLHRFNSDEISEKDLEYLVQNKFLNKTSSLIEFKHDLIKESIYDSIDISEKKILHDFAGLSIEKIYLEKIENYYYQLAEHFTKADNREKMIEYLEKAGDRARGEWDIEGALIYYEKYFSHFNDNLNYSTVLLKYCKCLSFIGKWESLSKYLEDFNTLKYLPIEIKIQFHLLKGEYYYNSGDLKKSLKCYQKLFLNYSIMQSSSLAEVYSQLCKLYIRQGDYLNGKMNAEFLLKTAQKIDNKKYIVEAFNYLARINLLNGKQDEALLYYKENLEILTILKEKFLIAETLNRIGSLLFSRREFKDAYVNFKKAHIIFRELRALKEIAMCLGNLANLDFITQKYSECEKKLLQQMHFYKILNDKFNLAILNNTLGNLYIKLGRYIESESYFEKMLKLAKELKNNNLICTGYSNLGLIRMITGDFEKALTFFELQIIIARKLGITESVVKSLLNMACVFRRIKNYESALKMDNKAYRLIKKNKLDFYLKDFYLNCSENYFYTQNYNYAIYNINKFLEVTKENTEDFILGSFYLLRYNFWRDYNFLSKNEIEELLLSMRKKYKSIKEPLTIIELKFYYFQILKIICNPKTKGNFKKYRDLFKKELLIIYEKFPNWDVSFYLNSI